MNGIFFVNIRKKYIYLFPFFHRGKGVFFRVVFGGVRRTISGGRGGGIVAVSMAPGRRFMPFVGGGGGRFVTVYWQHGCV